MLMIDEFTLLLGLSRGESECEWRECGGTSLAGVLGREDRSGRQLSLGEQPRSAHAQHHAQTGQLRLCSAQLEHLHLDPASSRRTWLPCAPSHRPPHLPYPCQPTRWQTSAEPAPPPHHLSQPPTQNLRRPTSALRRSPTQTRPPSWAPPPPLSRTAASQPLNCTTPSQTPGDPQPSVPLTRALRRRIPCPPSPRPASSAGARLESWEHWRRRAAVHPVEGHIQLQPRSTKT